MPLAPPHPKHALVTAGGGGIGLCIATRLAREGWRVDVAEIDGSTEAAVTAAGARFHECDVADADALQALFQRIEGPDLLVNNSGIAGPTLPVRALPIADWRRVLEVNLTAHFHAAQLAVPRMAANGGGVIVNMASVAAKIGFADRSPYVASKWGVLGLTATLAQEVAAANIRVNAILPGSTRGERIDRVLADYAAANGKTPAEAEADYLARQPIKHFVEPDEIAAMVSYLASDAARSITGQFISIDGGYR